MKRSSFCIAIEGTDGSGKTTLANNISKYINLNSEEFNDYHAFTISFPFHLSYLVSSKSAKCLWGHFSQEVITP